MSINNLNVDALIIGSGPVGLVLANILKRNGLSVLVIDKRTKKADLPRGIAINQATLDVFSTLGIKCIFDSGLQVEYIDLFWKHKYLGQINFHDTSYECPYFFHIPQSELENHLEKALLELDLQVHYGTELISYIQDGQHVYAQLRSNDEITIKTKFLIGCDGGQSKVREIMACGNDQRQYGASFVLSDVRFKNYNERNTRYIFTKAGYAMIVPLPEQQYRLIFSIQPNKSNSESDLSITNFQQLLNDRVCNDIAIAEIIWATQAQYGHRISNKIYQDRVVLAGDALHQFSPVGGTNMNVGIQDAYSLGWRLVHAINTSYSTLTEYELERKDVIKNQQQITEKITALITRSKNYFELLSPSKNYSIHSLTGYLTGLISGDGNQHVQNLIDYRELKKHVEDIRAEFAKTNYVFFTQGILNEGLTEQIKKDLGKNRWITWIHNANTELFSFIFCRPDGMVALHGNINKLDQIFKLKILNRSN